MHSIIVCKTYFIKEIVMKFESQLLRGIAPTVVLEILSRGQMYGYELRKAIEQRSNNIPSYKNR